MDTPNLNTATTTQLTGMKGIGNEYAQRILGKCPFRDLDDCESRTKIPRTLLEQFHINNSGNFYQ
ncbi:4728_t:CDS:2 [Entrophospora sp. SA101]|nr:4728_t:CDS:2 [Entrophospora sp. SA101]